MKQIPAPGTNLLTHCGDTITFTLRMGVARRGRAVLRTSLGGAAIKHRETLASAEEGRPALALDWSDRAMVEVEPGLHQVRVPLLEVGCFHAKTCFFPEGGGRAEWPTGDDVHIKTEPSWTVAGASVYTAFPRQFGAFCEAEQSAFDDSLSAPLDQVGWTVIPPSGTFRSLAKKLDTILGEERFAILQLLPIHPVPTTFARMGRYGSPFASTDFLGVNPAFAEFDLSATPIDQFRELVIAVHSRGARVFLDLPANHTGWASTLQVHHPEWFRHSEEGRFVSPGAWGTIWEDLVELDYSKPGLCEFMAGVFEFWCKQGVDGFRCDAGYMVPATVWSYIVAKVREQFPDTVFLLEGLGGKISVTRELIAEAGLNWAYSEVFQTEDRAAFEHYLPGALALSDETGPLIHYAETHDNSRLAARSPRNSTMRTALAAMLSHQGCFGITNGVEWFATEKVDVHGASALRWGHADNQVAFIGRLNDLLSSHPAFRAGAHVRMVQRRTGNSLAIIRTPAAGGMQTRLLVLVNLDVDSPQSVSWPAMEFISAAPSYDLLGGKVYTLPHEKHGFCSVTLEPGQVLCLAQTEEELVALEAEVAGPRRFAIPAVRKQALRVLALRIRQALVDDTALGLEDDVDAMAQSLAEDPMAFISSLTGEGSMPRVTECVLPEDLNRIVMIPPGHLLLVRAPHPFRCSVEQDSGRIRGVAWSNEQVGGGNFAVLIAPLKTKQNQEMGWLKLVSYPFAKPCAPASIRLCALPKADVKSLQIRRSFTGAEVLRGDRVGLLTNGCGAMSHVRAKWGDIRSQYDAILAANPDPRIPCDRQVLFTRCRAWIVNQGYSSEINASCLVKFECAAGSAVARWLFKVPVGTGRSVSLSISLLLHRNENRVTLVSERLSGADDSEMLDDDAPVQLILRPDIESRSFHHKTKAFAGPEREWPGCVSPLPGGFTFKPHGVPGLVMRASGGAFISETEWHYMVPHPDDAGRGLDGSSDLFSPGWFTAMLEGGETIELDAECLCNGGAPGGVIRGSGEKPIPSFKPVPLRTALSDALRDYVVRRDEFMTVIAGYPWFLDWGRDTFIVLRGMIADGMTKEALDIVRKFGEFELGGTLPNMINGADASNRDTSDAQLWYVVSVGDLARKIGAKKVLDATCGDRTVREVILRIGEGYKRGTKNGIRMDEASGLVYSPSHYTWMDTNHPAATPRAGYPVEIQALWIASLAFMTKIDKDGPWKALEKLARSSFIQYFWLADKGFLSDCLHADSFAPASQAVADDHLRCNQLFALTLGALTDKEKCARSLRSSARLLVPGGIRTLAPGKVDFALPVYRDGVSLNDPTMPYWGRYEGDEDTRRKPAYHNGTGWTWPFPAYAEALVSVYGESAQETAKALIGSAVDLLHRDCVGQLPEIMDGDAPHTGRGCDAQAWGISEFLRVALLLGM